MAYPLRLVDVHEHLERNFISAGDEFDFITNSMNTIYMDMDLTEFRMRCFDLYNRIEPYRRMPYIFLLGGIFIEIRDCIKATTFGNEKLEVIEEIMRMPNTPGDLMLLGKWIESYKKLAYVDITYTEWKRLAPQFWQLLKKSRYEDFWMGLSDVVAESDTHDEDFDLAKMSDNELEMKRKHITEAILADVKAQIQTTVREAFSEAIKEFANVLL